MSGFNGTPEDVGGIPIASVIVPGNKTPVATKGGPATTDSQGNPLAGVSMYGYSGDIVDLATLLTLAGTPGDANTVASLMGRLTKIRDLLNLISYDNTTEIKVSIYGTNATGGDTAIGINGSGNLKTNINGVSAGVTFPGNAEAAIGGTTAPSKELLMGGKTNDGTPQYQPLPEGAGGRSVIVEGFTGGTAVPVSNASLPLPAGAATSAKQPALGTAGTPSTDVLSVQGIASMTPLKTDGSGVTQPVSGTFWQATQPVSAASLPLPTGAALETGGHLASIDTEIGSHLSNLDTHIPANIINTGTPTETAVSVGTSSTSVLAANANRKFLLLTNDSAAIIYLSIGGNAAALNAGQRLNANGGSLLLDRYLATSAVHAIATAASANLLVTEG